MSTKEKKIDYNNDFAELLTEYRENCKKQIKIDEINLQKEKEDFELEWIKAGLQIFRK